MAKATGLHDCRRFAEQVSACGGQLPDELGYLLQAFDLLSSPEVAEAAERDILTAALDGSLTRKKLEPLIVKAATAQMISDYRGDFARRSEHTLVGQWHRSMETAADTILASVRPQFSRAAEGVARAKALISMETDAEQLLNSVEPAAVTEWQALPTHLRVLDRIGNLAAQFGPDGPFPMVRQFPAAHNHLVDARALFATGGALLVDSAAFRRIGGPSPRQSPWVHVGVLQLQSIEGVRARYTEFCADQWDAQNLDRPRPGRIIDGQMVYDQPPKNPFRQEANV